MKPGFDSSLINMQHIRNLIDFHFLKIIKDNDRSLLYIQGHDRFQNLT